MSDSLLNFLTSQFCLHRTWFHFAVKGCPQNRLVRINMINLNKQGKLYNQGMSPVVKVIPQKPKWERIRDKPTHEVCWVGYYTEKIQKILIWKCTCNILLGLGQGRGEVIEGFEGIIGDVANSKRPLLIIRKCYCACALLAEVQLCLRVTRRSWQKLLAGKNFVKILVTAQMQLRSYSEQQRAFGNSNICN